MFSSPIEMFPAIFLQFDWCFFVRSMVQPPFHASGASGSQKKNLYLLNWTKQILETTIFLQGPQNGTFKALFPAFTQKFSETVKLLNSATMPRLYRVNGFEEICNIVKNIWSEQGKLGYWSEMGNRKWVFGSEMVSGFYDLGSTPHPR